LWEQRVRDIKAEDAMRHPDGSPDRASDPPTETAT
jgi:hypothetical protein